MTSSVVAAGKSSGSARCSFAVVLTAAAGDQPQKVEEQLVMEAEIENTKAGADTVEDESAGEDWRLEMVSSLPQTRQVMHPSTSVAKGAQAPGTEESSSGEVVTDHDPALTNAETRMDNGEQLDGGKEQETGVAEVTEGNEVAEVTEEPRTPEAMVKERQQKADVWTDAGGQRRTSCPVCGLVLNVKSVEYTVDENECMAWRKVGANNDSRH